MVRPVPSANKTYGIPSQRVSTGMRIPTSNALPVEWIRQSKVQELPGPLKGPVVFSSAFVPLFFRSKAEKRGPLGVQVVINHYECPLKKLEV